MPETNEPGRGIGRFSLARVRLVLALLWLVAAVVAGVTLGWPGAAALAVIAAVTVLPRVVIGRED